MEPMTQYSGASFAAVEFRAPRSRLLAARGFRI